MLDESEVNEIGNELLLLAEINFGKRKDLIFHGFEIWDLPYAEFRGTLEKGFTIYLNEGVLIDKSETIFQCAHEIIHLLSPSATKRASVFEEGWATYFSFEMLQLYGFKEYAQQCLGKLEKEDRAYFEAYCLFKEINNPNEVIKKIRSNNDIPFSELTQNHLSVYEEIPQEVIPELINEFY